MLRAEHVNGSGVTSEIHLEFRIISSLHFWTLHNTQISKLYKTKDRFSILDNCCFSNFSLQQKSLVHKNVLGQFRVVLEEASEETDRVGNIVCASSLANTVHAELRVAQIEGPSSQGSRQHGADGAAAA